MTNIEQQARELAKLKLSELRVKFQELTGTETKSNNRPYLIKKILVAVGADGSDAHQATSAAKEEVLMTPSAASTKRSSKKSERDPRLPKVGEVIEREHEGKTIRVKVLDEGFSFRSKTYRSLSAIAKEVTGTVWNGFLFFGLDKRPKEGAR